MRRLIAVIALSLFATLAHGGQVAIEGVRSWAGPDHTRVVFDLSSPVEHRLFTLQDPERVVVDIRDAQLGEASTSGLTDGGILKKVRSAPRNGDDVRVVFDLARDVDPKSFIVPPNEEYGHRLVVDLEKPRDKTEPVKTVPEKAGELVIAIDAGHGGEDPGAIGPRGTHEKDIVMSVARKLEHVIDKRDDMRALLIRDGDYYIGLNERRQKAHQAGADMFLSLHADAFRDHSVRGSSVFVLSADGASSEMAKMLAANENASDRIAGVSLENREKDVQSVLVDLSRRATIESSAGLARSVLTELADTGRVHSDDVERAGFAVLKSLDMPSVLVELAFISNPVEERRLRTDDYQWQLARAIRRGVADFAEDRMSTLKIASGQAYREYTVERGDTLSAIARRHRVSVARLRQVNGLQGSTIRVGQTLRIP
jgi:N-acetylmuramoyl-L-alanine amidase